MTLWKQAIALSSLCVAGTAYAAPIDFDTALNTAHFPAATSDRNGPAAGANGILDSDELALLGAILDDENALNHASVTAAWNANLAQMQAALGALGPAAANYITPLAALMCVSADSQAAVASLLTPFGVTLNLANFSGGAFATLAPGADPDGDTISNKDEYDAISGTGGPGSQKRALWISDILGTTVEGEPEGSTEGEGSNEEGEGDGDPVDPCVLVGGCPNFSAQGFGTIAGLAAYGALPPGTTWMNVDLDQGGILDRYEVALLSAILCGSSAFGQAAVCTFGQNLLTIQSEPAYNFIGPNADDLFAALASIGSEMQAAIAPLGLQNTYTAIGASAKTISEPLSPSGDADGDGISNLQEYLNVIADGGSEADYVAAATNPLLDGTAASFNALPAAGLGGLGALLTALGSLSALALRRKQK